MKVNQARISNSVSLFKNAYLSKFHLADAYDVNSPVVFIGMYRDTDYRAFRMFKDKIIVIWCGADSLMITPERAAILKSVKATHIVKSQFCSDDLKKFGIPHKIIPISWQEQNIEPRPLGDCIYHYGNNDAYGNHLIDEIAEKTGLRIYRTDYKTFKKKELLKIYEKCFIGLRLTKHDGLPNTVLELGMMGRKCIYNGGIPTSIKWDSTISIINSILKEYANRKTADYKSVSDQIKKFINIDNEWLKI